MPLYGLKILYRAPEVTSTAPFLIGCLLAIWLQALFFLHLSTQLATQLAFISAIAGREAEGPLSAPHVEEKIKGCPAGISVEPILQPLFIKGLSLGFRQLISPLVNSLCSSLLINRQYLIVDGSR